MNRYIFETVDVFTNQRFGGNPLAVFPYATGLSSADMQSLAAEFNLSETTFVFPPADPANTAHVRIFNRTAEMPFAGHPNVGTAFVLARSGHVIDDLMRFEQLAGVVEVRLSRDQAGDVAGATIQAPQPLSLGDEIPVAEVAECASLHPDDVIVRTHAPILASVGNPYVIAEVTGRALTRAIPDVTAFRRAVAARPTLDGRYSLHLYARDGADIRARMFAPLAGTMEDPATGSANAPLGALLLSLTADDFREDTIVQGIEMGRPSRLYVSARRTAGEIRASVRGQCVPVFAGTAVL